MTLNNWTAQFADPGPVPEQPEGRCPEHDGTREALELRRAWTKKFNIHNDWVLKNRKHLVARALDKLEAKQAHQIEHEGHAHPEAVEIIALVLGTSYLQGDGGDPFLRLFGGLLGG